MMPVVVNGKAAKTVRERLKQLEWEEIEQCLWKYGYAKTPAVLTPKECRESAALYSQDALFRSTIDMERYKFGVGQYRYFSYPLPRLVGELRTHAYHYLAGNRAAVVAFLPSVIIGAGFGEETFFRGYLFERLGKLLGHGAVARVATVLLTSALFGAVHYPVQGLAGAEQATVTGLVFGTIFAVTGRIWMLMCAHAAFDLAAVAIIYWNLEAKLAHLVFK